MRALLDDVRSTAAESNDCEYRQHYDEWRSKPILFLTFVQHHLQAPQADRDQAEAEIINPNAAPRGVLMLPLAVKVPGDCAIAVEA